MIKNYKSLINGVVNVGCKQKEIFVNQLKINADGKSYGNNYVINIWNRILQRIIYLNLNEETLYLNENNKITSCNIKIDSQIKIYKNMK